MHAKSLIDLLLLLKQGAEVDHAGRLYWIQDPRDELCVGEVSAWDVCVCVCVCGVCRMDRMKRRRRI